MLSRRVSLVGTGLALVLAVSFGVAGYVAAQDEPRETGSVADKPVTEADLAGSIDREIAKVWERDGIKPAKASSDEEFVRRVYLDTIGLPPSRDEALAFIDSKEKDKREKLIAKLVDDKRFGEHMGDLWSLIMLGRGGGMGGDRGGSSTMFGIWIADRINANAKFSDIIYEIITADGSLSENPAVAPYVRERPYKIANAAGLLTKNLTGVQIQCAECHDHPYEKEWKQTTFNGVASFFSAVNQRQDNRSVPQDPSISDDPRPVRLPGRVAENLPPQAQERQAEVLRYSKPVTLDGKAVKTQSRDFWRPYLAKWMIEPGNKQTARYVANRFWSFALGMGIHNPVDDFNSLNTPSHPELLDLLAADLVASKYDIKRLYRAILGSRTYQLSSKDGPQKAESWHFASAAPRQLSPEQFFGALVTVAGGGELARVFRGRMDPVQNVRRNYENRKRQAERDSENMRDYTFDEAALKRYEEWYLKMSDGWYMRRALAAGFATQSEDDEMTEANGFSLSIDQALAVMNGDVVNRITGSGRGSVVGDLVAKVKGDEARLETLFLTVLSRRPTNAEKSRLLTFIGGTKDTAAAYEDIMFALVAGSEFATNH